LTNAAENPLLAPWNDPFSAPPFSHVRPEHFRPGFDAALAERRAEIAAIRANPEPATFENTIVEMERAGKALNRVSRVFFHLASADTNEALEAIEREIAPILARESQAIFLDDELFRRVDWVKAGAAAAGLGAEERRLVDRYHIAFVRSGAGLDAERKARLAAIGERLASLGAEFGQNVLGDERDYLLLLETEDDLAGLPSEFRSAAHATATARGASGKFAVTLSRSSVEPFLQFSARRNLREKVWRAFVARGANGGARDNGAIMNETLKLRAEMASLLGYASYADYRLTDTMAKTPAAATGLMKQVWAPARARALSEAAALQEMIVAEGGNYELKPWDWRYYAEKRRVALHNFDEGALKAYLPLEGMIEASFETARRLFGLTFVKRTDIDLPHKDARAFEVKDGTGKTIALFIGDYFARPSKRSGAWMSSLRVQSRLDGETLPIVLNTMSFSAPGEGAPSLLSHDEAHTLFHEFGHALHGILSDVMYPWLSGTAVARDFVELPSQLYEHWLDQPAILSEFARHHETGAPLPKPLLDAVIAARRYGQGFATSEFLASSFFDMAAHSLPPSADFDAQEIERKTLAEMGMPDAIAPRHGAAHFQHVFAGSGYSAGYYSYLWSEVLDADAFEAFVAAGDPFDPALAERLREFVYSAGNKRPPDEAYIAFRGREPSPDALLRKRGFAPDKEKAA
jgi:peptidyl-dipeptidase Dcp